MRIKWKSLADLVAREHALAAAPSSAHDREAVKQALEREGRLEEHKKTAARARKRIRRWFKED